MSVFDVRSSIRGDAAPQKGKKCPGGYWIPRMEERARADSILSSLSARIYPGLTLNVDTSDACAQVRNDAMKGKKCPGGYFIPRKNKCREGGEKAKPSRPMREGADPGSKPSKMKSARGKGVKSGLIVGGGLAAVGTVGAIGLLGMRKGSEKAQEEAQDRRSRGYQPSPEGKAREEAVREEFRKAKERAEEFRRQSRQRRAQSTGSGAGSGSGYAPGAGSQRARVATERGNNFAREEKDFAQSFGLSSNPTRKEIKAARIKAAKQYHPDKFAGDEKARKAAEKKMQEINSAVDRLMKNARRDSFLTVFRANTSKEGTPLGRSTMDSFDACAQIRNDAMKGKKCPGGYSIPVNKQCGKGGKGGKMRSPGETNNANRWRLAGAVALGGLAMHQSDRIKQEKERRKNEMKEWDDLQKASGETLNSARGLNRNKRRKDSVLGRSTMDSFDACAQIRDNGKRME